MGRCQRRRRRKEKQRLREKESQGLYELFHWLRANGWKSTIPLRIYDFKLTGRGLQCMQNVPKDSVIVSITERLLITRSLVERHLNSCSDSSLTTHELLSVFLMKQSHLGKASFWHPYLNLLPKAYTVPFFATPEEVRCFPRYLRTACLEMHEKIALICKKIKKHKLIANNLSFDSDNFYWAWFTVNTRAIYVSDPSNDLDRTNSDSMALAPFLDMFNHSFDCSVSVGLKCQPDSGSRNFQIVTRNSYSKFDQVFINYGPHDNLRMYLEYGFVIPGNPNETVPILLQELVDIITENAFVERENVDTVVASGLANKMAFDATGISWNTLASLSILRMSSNELKNWYVVYELDFGKAGNDLEVSKLMHSKITAISQGIQRLDEMENLSASGLVALDFLRLQMQCLEKAKRSMNYS